MGVPFAVLARGGRDVGVIKLLYRVPPWSVRRDAARPPHLDEHRRLTPTTTVARVAMLSRLHRHRLCDESQRSDRAWRHSLTCRTLLTWRDGLRLLHSLLTRGRFSPRRSGCPPTRVCAICRTPVRTSAWWSWRTRPGTTRRYSPAQSAQRRHSSRRGLSPAEVGRTTSDPSAQARQRE